MTKDDYIITAYAERASGPGWANSPVWIIVRDGNGIIRQECLQPDEQSAEVLALYEVSAAAHRSMIAAVERCVKRGMARK